MELTPQGIKLAMRKLDSLEQRTPSSPRSVLPLVSKTMLVMVKVRSKAKIGRYSKAKELADGFLGLLKNICDGRRLTVRDNRYKSVVSVLYIIVNDSTNTLKCFTFFSIVCCE